MNSNSGSCWTTRWKGSVSTSRGARRPLRLFSPIYVQTIGIIQALDIMPDGTG
jgi:hypothetical protein